MVVVFVGASASGKTTLPPPMTGESHRLGASYGPARYHHANLDVSQSAHETYTITADDFESARGETTWNTTFARDGWEAPTVTPTVTHTVLACSRTAFTVNAQLDAYLGAHGLESRSWCDVIPRHRL